MLMQGSTANKRMCIQTNSTQPNATYVSKCTIIQLYVSKSLSYKSLSFLKKKNSLLNFAKTHTHNLMLYSPNSGR